MPALPPFIRRIEKIFGCTYAEYLIVKPQRKALDAFTSQRSHAKWRGVDWELNLWEWWTIWHESGRWDERGRGRAAYCMCRKGDAGPYAVGNVFIALFRENSSEHPSKTKDWPIGVKTDPRNKSDRFYAQRRINGKMVHLGAYPTSELAHAAYLASIHAQGVQP